MLATVLKYLQEGKVIAYPTEAVYGFGCDPFNQEAVNKLLQIKHRNPDKGLILVASDWRQIENLVEPIPPIALSQVLASWPGPHTWVFPASTLVPHWIRGKHRTIAVRVSAHPIIQEICQIFTGPIVSTSANRESEPALRDTRTVQMMFSKQIDFIVPGKVSGQARPTTIRDAISGTVLRP